MSTLTASGRKQLRDWQRHNVSLWVARDPVLKGMPAHQRHALAELKLVGRALFADIKNRGVIVPDGTVNPAVEAHRKNAHEQLVSLQVFIELNRAHNSEPRDLVAEMARAIEEPAADLTEPTPAWAGGWESTIAVADGVDAAPAAPDDQAALAFGEPNEDGDCHSVMQGNGAGRSGPCMRKQC